MPDKLMSLEEHNAIVAQQYHDPQANLPAKNGLACPVCGKEMFDTTPNMIHVSHPPRKAIHCRCGYRGWRNA